MAAVTVNRVIDGQGFTYIKASPARNSDQEPVIPVRASIIVRKPGSLILVTRFVRIRRKNWDREL